MIFSPASAARRNRTTSLVRWYGSANGMPFHRSTITFDEEPTPITKRPGAASASAATDWASSAGPRVKAGMMATPRRSSGAHCDARASGVNPSVPSASEDQASL